MNSIIKLLLKKRINRLINRRAYAIENMEKATGGNALYHMGIKSGIERSLWVLTGDLW